jgi:O-acetyl-ADP-ribose deacetylase (regulator of RNase III)
MITKINGDLFNTKQRIIAHGVNCQGVFNAGVAKQIASRFPKVKKLYLDKQWTPGDIQVCPVLKDRTPDFIMNLATQNYYGSGQDFVVYNALYACFVQLFEFAEFLGCGVAIPKIGSGLAGGDWTRIYKIIEACIKHRPIELEIYAKEG